MKRSREFLRVLFISSGKAGDVGIVVRNQGESLRKAGLDLDYFIITPGFRGYVRAIFQIRKKISNGHYDIAHAHYSLSAFSASLAGKFPLVVSLMGSDAYLSWPFRLLAQVLSRVRWDATIVKTNEIKNILRIKDAKIIPNGVDIEQFIQIDKLDAREKLNIAHDSKVALFISPKNRPEKNLTMAQRAIEALKTYKVDLLHIHDTPNSEIPYYLNATDFLLLTSSREGSVNVIKEAMSCNCPIVATDVGDVRWVIGTTEGCLIAEANENDLAQKMKLVLERGKRTDGRERIMSLGLSAEKIAERIKLVYYDVLERYE